MSKQNTEVALLSEHPLSKYYKFQSRIYDTTRWSFLFGRRQIIKQLPIGKNTNSRILEVGCGTGYNLVALAKQFPKAEIMGIDLSADMITIARKKTAAFKGRVSTVHGAFGPDSFREQFDLILFSYCLTMINPGWDYLVDLSSEYLRKDGSIAVVDFHNSKIPAFKRHMARHHVRMDGQVLERLKNNYSAEVVEVHAAYGGLWEWFSFVGRPLKASH
jgi:S-adenosylmethionine-diacylgycerolhomoserine-N-methlytransferase